MAADKDSDIKTVQVLDRAVKILDVVAAGSDPVNSNRIVQETGIHASTAHRLLWSLTELGFLEHTTENCWRLGLRFLEYGNRVRRALPVRTAAVDVMRSLYEKTQLTVNLSMRSADSIMYIDHVYAPKTGVRFSRQVGAVAPMHCTSGGKLFLREMTPEDLSAYIERTHLAPRTSHSLATREKLIIELDRIRERGWAEDNEELEYGIRCIGAPIRDENGRITAAVTLVSDTEIKRKPEFVDLHVKGAAQISAALASAAQPAA